MENALLTTLCEEIRADFQIPPYTPDEIIERAVRRCAARLESLKPGVNFETDTIGRGLLGNYVYYDMMHRAEEFLLNFGPDVRSWQLSEEVETDETSEDG